MLVESYIHMEGEDIIEVELSIDELVDTTLGSNFTNDFRLNLDLTHSVEVNDVTPPTAKLSDAKNHALLLFSFLFDNFAYLVSMKLLLSSI